MESASSLSAAASKSRRGWYGLGSIASTSIPNTESSRLGVKGSRWPRETTGAPPATGAPDGAPPRGAHLRDADLRDADLRGAFLRGADLRGADLTGAVLTGAFLRGADLRGADLRDAVLRDADLGADLRDAVLRDADLTGAVITGAFLRGADLTRAVLRDAVLRDADLTGADLRDAREDFRKILAAAPAEVAGLLLAVNEGRIDGGCYEGECCCLIGTIANMRGVDYRDLAKSSVELEPDMSRPAEVLFLAISRGHKPETNSVAKIVRDWIVEWQAEQASAGASS